MTGSEQEAARLAAAVRAAPHDRFGWHNLAVELRRLGRNDEGLAAIERAWALTPRAPETGLMRAHLLADAGRFDEAIAAYRWTVAARPDLVDAHETLARLMPALGRGGEALDSYREALAVAPDRGALWVSALSTAQALGAGDQLLAWAMAAEARFGRDAIVVSALAAGLGLVGRDAEAADAWRGVVAMAPGDAGAQGGLAYALLKLRDLPGAEAAALAAVKAAPLEQQSWALLTIIWRLRGDPREEWLADYERLVMPVALEGIDLTRLAEVLTGLHVTRTHPGDQSLRGGTQTRGDLLTRPEPELRALAIAIERAIGAVLAGLPDDATHPFLGRNTGRATILGSWSVRLASEGFHISHIHQRGWLSSACYVALPPEVGAGEAGALAFGVPDAALGIDLPPRRIVRPEPGLLVLFPSYFWHGTLPFTSARPRLTVAFDALPA